MPVHNSELADMFNQLGKLLDIEGANVFKVRAYQRAAQIVSGLNKNIEDMVDQGEDLTSIDGIGKELAAKLKEGVKTGKLKKLEEVKKRVPEELLQLHGLAGLGPRKIGTLYKELGITNLDDLEKSARSGKISQLSGFGQKTESKILKALEEKKQQKPQRHKIATVEEIATSLLSYLKKVKTIDQIEVAGSYRRRKETVKDLDMVISTEKPLEIMDYFLRYQDIHEVVMKGETRTSVLLKTGIQVDVRVVGYQSYGAALNYFTGSKAHNIALRTLALKRDWKINEYGIFEGQKQIAGQDEQEIYKALGLDFIEPELREDTGEVEAAQEGKLPNLVKLSDIKGDLHVHSLYSDGRNSLKDIAQAAKKRGYQYIAVTDHSQRLKMARGLDEGRLRNQIEEIDKLNQKLKDIVILKGIEVDILEDGSLDLPESILKKLDVIVAAVHSGFNLSKEKQTKRILKAVDNKLVNILAHPSGRIINSREPYVLDLEKIFTEAVDKNCYMEINSQPDRLDLNDVQIRAAKEKGVKMVINTDSHHLGNLDLMKFGLDQARRGWLEKKDVINARSLSELKAFFNQ